MKERPVLFSGSMVRAILEGRKSMTRRVVKSRHPVRFLGGKGDEDDPGEWGYEYDDGYMVLGRGFDEQRDRGRVSIPSPYGAPGDRLWVRETWAVGRVFDRTRPAEIPTVERDVPVWWRADGFAEESDNRGRWRPSIHMPRWASRITLDIVSVRVERLQTITTLDAMAEGAEPVRNAAGVLSYTTGFRTLWDSINGARPGCSWDDDPWVWVVEFRGTT